MAKAKRVSKAAKAPEPRLTGIYVSGFKSLRDRTEIELRPLTLLAGRNSSGKSSVMQALLLLKQTLEAPFDPGPLRLDGPNVRFTSTEQLFWKGAQKGDVASEIAIGFRGSWGTPRRKGVSAQTTSIVFRREHRRPDILVIDRQEFADLKDSKQRGTLREGMTSRELRAFMETFRLSSGSASPIVSRNRSFLRIGIPVLGRLALLSLHLTEWPPWQLERIIHLAGLRGNPERSYAVTEVGRWFPGSFHHYTASVMASWQDNRDVRLRRLGEFLALLGLTWKAEARRVDATQVEVRVGRLPSRVRGGTRDLVNIADVGVGVSQTLPLLVALLAAEPGQIVYVEQPEIHLHPSAQVLLARCLLDAAKRGVIVVAETHSHLLLKGVQLEVARGADPKLVKLHWFARDVDGATHVTSADLDEQGAFGDWPEDFADVELDVESKYLRASMPAGKA